MPDASAIDTVSPWYCIRAQPRRESIAAAHLPTLPGVEIFFPRVRYMRRTRRGPQQSTVPLFPGYLFSRFPKQLAKQVTYTQGVAHIVRRGAELAEVPQTVMEELLALAPNGIVGIGDPEFKIGQKIRVISGVFLGAEAKIIRLAPAKQRVAVLMQFLGQEQEVEIDIGQIDLPDSNPRKRVR
jgi:transcriptional antiterminator RfaH